MSQWLAWSERHQIGRVNKMACKKVGAQKTLWRNHAARWHELAAQPRSFRLRRKLRQIQNSDYLVAIQIPRIFGTFADICVARSCNVSDFNIFYHDNCRILVAILWLLIYFARDMHSSSILRIFVFWSSRLFFVFCWFAFQPEGYLRKTKSLNKAIWLLHHVLVL